MNKFVPKEKLSKKAQKQKAAEKRTVWMFSPVTQRIESKKIYNRKRISRTRYDDGSGDFLCFCFSDFRNCFSGSRKRLVIRPDKCYNPL